MLRRLAASALVIVLLVAQPATGAYAQKETPIVVGEGAGQYVQAASPSLTGAFDRAIGELDAAPSTPTPREVKDASFRRRFLELRLLTDVYAFGYDKTEMKKYRAIVDHAYEGIGVFQDVADIEKELGTTVSPEVVNSRRVEMDDGLAPMRDPHTRGEMRQFFAAPLKAPRSGGGPHLWDVSGSVASNDFDATGNAALLQSGIVNNLQSVDLGIRDIFDPDQAAYFHAIRKEMRSVVLLSAMFPATNAATREVVKPLDDLVGDYGDTLDAFNAYVFALQSGMDTSKVGAEVAREFERAQMMKAELVETHALDAMAIQLNNVREAHRR